MFVLIDGNAYNRNHITRMHIRGASPTEVYVRIYQTEFPSPGYFEHGPFGSDAEATERLKEIVSGTYSADL